jgi:hypothetical protein
MIPYLRLPLLPLHRKAEAPGDGATGTTRGIYLFIVSEHKPGSKKYSEVTCHSIFPHGSKSLATFLIYALLKLTSYFLIQLCASQPQK